MPYAYITCRISRGAFSGERVFQIRLDGGAEYIGVAPKDYFRKENNDPLQADEPTEEASLNGKLMARVIKNGGSKARVALPDGEAVIVPSDSITKAKEEPEDVPV